MQFIITALDGRDGEALDRRMAARPAHLEYAAKAIEAGKMLIGGAMLDDDGKMIGSMLVVDYPSKEDVEKEYLANDPYVKGDVWRDIDIKPYKVAEVFMKK